MTPGKGYISQGPLQGTYPQKHLIDFQGIRNNGIIDMALVFNANTNDDTTNDYDDYNLVENPYPSAIYADMFLDIGQNPNIDGTVRLKVNKIIYI